MKYKAENPKQSPSPRESSQTPSERERERERERGHSLYNLFKKKKKKHVDITTLTKIKAYFILVKMLNFILLETIKSIRQLY